MGIGPCSIAATATRVREQSPQALLKWDCERSDTAISMVHEEVRGVKVSVFLQVEANSDRLRSYSRGPAQSQYFTLVITIAPMEVSAQLCLSNEIQCVHIAHMLKPSDYSCLLAE